MSLVHHFQSTRNTSLHSRLGVPDEDDRDFLVVTALDLENPSHIAQSSRHNILKYPLPTNTDADQMLRRITAWMKRTQAFDQSYLYGEDQLAYTIHFYALPPGSPCFISLRGDFLLEDFVFSDRNIKDAMSFDDLMRMLDRDRMAFAMRKSLIEDFDIPERIDAPRLWIRDIRQCSHPDYKNIQALPQDGQPVSRCA